jgi:hypothetical protein
MTRERSNTKLTLDTRNLIECLHDSKFVFLPHSPWLHQIALNHTILPPIRNVNLWFFDSARVKWRQLAIGKHDHKKTIFILIKRVIWVKWDNEEEQIFTEFSFRGCFVESLKRVWGKSKSFAVSTAHKFLFLWIASSQHGMGKVCCLKHCRQNHGYTLLWDIAYMLFSFFSREHILMLLRSEWEQAIKLFFMSSVLSKAQTLNIMISVCRDDNIQCWKNDPQIHKKDFQFLWWYKSDKKVWFHLNLFLILIFQ